jgi:multiple sugar transport system permease protein
MQTSATSPLPVEKSNLPWWNRKSTLKQINLGCSFIIIVIGAIILMVPLAWMLSTALKSDGEVFIVPIRWIPTKIFWSNFPDAVNYVPYLTFYWNSIRVVALVVLGSVLSASLVAFAFARLRAPGKNILFIIMLSTLMLPGEVTMVPVYLLFKFLGWLDSYRPLIVPYWFGGSPFYIFLLRQFFMTLPTELDDAAKIDGATLFDIYWRILLPLAKPALATVAIFSFFDSWNDFRGPLIYLNSEFLYTIPIGLRLYMSALANTHWNYLMAATLLAIIPPLIIFFTMQRYFVQGAILTGLKG